ncbi:hydroxymethylglutaryl-CoA lyase [Falsirhodobacter halotolerans]|uniref:hydroxymethylglutaryl-CoA lyase n=1 Tax=Falsirhodobacter halotolerans TaxID=1146892 RepID=UPI001FCFE5A3|nr:hydroxymethylglutaryl-CoA lyase [Falsirhodobacter halotolerans]MCJ8140034.1 hydroxymethylglutaryl-CoA lyase [Falsirhodobacter halotolerans]
MTAQDQVRIVEVGPRDGLQNEAAPLDVPGRVAMIEGLIASGLSTVEVGSFVSPRWVPQMAGSDDVLAAFAHRTELRLPVLVPNMKGFLAAKAAGAREIAVFASASESFSQRNINCSIDESLERFRPVMDAAAEAGIAVRGYVSCAWGCPYEGAVDPAAVVRVSAALHAMGCYEISVSDTIGTGTPTAARGVIEAVAGSVPMSALAVHVHDTYGQALANILACFQAGVRVFDASVGGLGGCPYAKGATGNVATEDLVFMLDGMGIGTGVDLRRLCAVAVDVSNRLGRPPSSHVARVFAQTGGEGYPFATGTT